MPELSIVLATLNERGNLLEVVSRIARALDGEAWEVIVVDDDSADGTADLARVLAASDPRVRCIRRLGRRGLSSACIEGILSSSAPFVAVMDADLQHDETLLPAMLTVLRSGEAPVVVASRYIEGGSTQGWSASRAALSRLATLMSGRRVLDRLSDPMSGFFALSRPLFEDHARSLSGLGFKLLLDFLSSAPASLQVRELPMRFGVRVAGRSKMSANVAWEFLLMLLDKRVGRFIPVRFIPFAAVGQAGVAVHFGVLTALLWGGGLPFTWAHAAATVAAMVFNFSANNVLTYSGMTLRGWRWLRGLGSFMLVCGAGAAANVGVANYLFGRAAGWPWAAAAGIAVGAVWNYALSARYTWKAS